MLAKKERKERKKIANANEAAATCRWRCCVHSWYTCHSVGLISGWKYVWQDESRLSVEKKKGGEFSNQPSACLLLGSLGSASRGQQS